MVGVGMHGHPRPSIAIVGGTILISHVCGPMSVACQWVVDRVPEPYRVRSMEARPVREIQQLSIPALLFKRWAVKLVGVLHGNFLQSQCVEIITSQCSLHPRLSLALLVSHVPTV